ncbi:MAG: FecR family protein [Bdellovibrionaceae bacterium]|nr:FecR family protein [Pseudobdellovibrionaceae bacterium]NUM59188.1 FecR domain-containing protein [Pseudobdellovibrionaceae bacterium]
MKTNFRRLFWAFFLSGSCFIATFLWSNAQEKKFQITDKNKIAQVTYTNEDARKKIARSLQWLPISSGDTLYDGDSIRTSDKSEVKISFDDGKSIVVDSGSTIVIQKNKSEISLDLVEGSLYVDAKQTVATDGDDRKTNKSEIIFRSDKNKFNLDGTKTILSKNKGQQTQVNILDGQAKFNDSSGKVKELSKGQSLTVTQNGIKTNLEIKIISPSLFKPGDQLSQVYFINPEADPTVRFKWKGFPKEQEISLLIGDSKKNMVEKANLPVASDSVNTLLPLGTYYWQLISKDPKTKNKLHSSSVYKLEIHSRYPPIILAPENNKIYEVETLPLGVNLKWQKPQDVKSVFLELSNHPQMLSSFLILKNINVSQVQDYLVKDLKEGDYYWRLSTKYHDSDLSFQTKIQKFSIKKLIKEPPKPPPVLAWTKTPEKQFYLSQPSIELNWEAQTRKNEITQWKIEVLNQNNESVAQQVSELNQFKVQLTASGRYIAYVEALDKAGQSMAKLSPRSIEISEFPLAKAPIFKIEDLKRNQLTNKVYFENGILDVQWNNQPIVKEYEIELIAKKSNDTEKLNSNKNRFEYRGKNGTGLTPGSYELVVTPIDQHDRRGPASESFEFEVPSQTSLSAPKLKNLNIKQSSD